MKAGKKVPLTEAEFDALSDYFAGPLPQEQGSDDAGLFFNRVASLPHPTGFLAYIK